MELSVLIPTSRRPHKLGAALTTLARQTLARDRFEVLVGIDGPENGELESVGPSPENVTILSFPRSGQAATRARLLEAARGKYALCIADSALCAPTLLESHLRVQASSPAKGGVISTGPVRLAPLKPERTIDRFLLGTRVFTGYALAPDERADAPITGGGFRAVSPLNLCVPVELAQRLGGFCRQLTSGQFDAQELAWRLLKWLKTPVIADARSSLDLEERPEPEDCYRRIITLGYESVQLAQMNPSCAMDVLGQEVCGPGAARSGKTIVTRERQAAIEAMTAFEMIAGTPTAGLAAGEVQSRVARAASNFEVARTWLWQLGQLAALENQTLTAVVSEFEYQRTGKSELIPASRQRAA